MLGRIVRTTIYLLLIGVVATLATAFALYCRTPAWYQPAANLSAQDLEQAGNEMSRHLSASNDKVAHTGAGEPVVIELTQDQANRYLAASLHSAGSTRPRELQEIMLLFRDDELVLAGRHADFADKLIAVHLAARDTDGQLTLGVDSVQINSLPLPQQFVSDQVDEVIMRLENAVANYTARPSQDPQIAQFMELVPVLLKALRGEPLPRDFVWDIGQMNRPVHLEQLKLSDGMLRLELRPRGEARERIEYTSPFEDAGGGSS